MADLYTTLVRAKQELNGGVLPAMTPVPENVQHFIDPTFTPGLGALEEDVAKGLRCPVRGCGEYFHVLSRHLNTKHADIGGATTVKRALDIPSTAALLSAAMRARHGEIMRRTWERGGLSRDRAADLARSRHKKGRKTAKTATHKTTGYRNLQNSCLAQISHRLIDLANQLGRSPNHREAKAIDGSLVDAATKLFGSWAAAKASVGLKVREGRGRYDREYILTILREYYDANGRLPRAPDVYYQRRTPLLPSCRAIQRALGGNTWREAMESAAAALGVRGGRYGIPLPREVLRKRCTKCQENLPLDAFHIQRMGRYGVESRCKRCRAEYSANRYKAATVAA